MFYSCSQNQLVSFSGSNLKVYMAASSEQWGQIDGSPLGLHKLVKTFICADFAVENKQEYRKLESTSLEGKCPWGPLRCHKTIANSSLPFSMICYSTCIKIPKNKIHKQLNMVKGKTNSKVFNYNFVLNTGVPAKGAWSQFSCQERLRLRRKSWKKGCVLLKTENPMMFTRWSATSSSRSRENS